MSAPSWPAVCAARERCSALSAFCCSAHSSARAAATEGALSTPTVATTRRGARSNEPFDVFLRARFMLSVRAAVAASSSPLDDWCGAATTALLGPADAAGVPFRRSARCLPRVRFSARCMRWCFFGRPSAPGGGAMGEGETDMEGGCGCAAGSSARVRLEGGAPGGRGRLAEDADADASSWSDRSLAGAAAAL